METEGLHIDDPIAYKGQLVPEMTQEEVRALEDILSEYMVVMEYGSGGSTLQYSQLVKKYCSVEHDPAWHERISKDLKEIDTDNRVVYLFKERGDEYIKACTLFDEKFDVILLDGCDREKCADFCYSYLKDDGLLLVHDAAHLIADTKARKRLNNASLDMRALLLRSLAADRENWTLKSEFVSLKEKYFIHNSTFSLFSFKKINSTN